MAKLTLSDLTNFNSTALGTISANNDLIEAALENTLSRDGTSPNQMAADLDMNGQDILNVNLLETDGLLISGETVDFVAIAEAVSDDADEAAASAAAALVSENAAAASAASAIAAKMTWRGDYSAVTSYVTSDVVHDQGSSWIALQSSTGNAPPTLPTESNAYWELISLVGNTGWTPTLSVTSDNARRVLRVIDWTGGQGTKPVTGYYVGTSGLVALAADAIDIRGAEGAGGTAATLAIGTVTTGAAGTSVIINNVGTSNAAILDITIPRGNDGAAGAGTGDMLAATYDPTGVGGNAFLMSNMVETATKKILTDSERATIADAATLSTTNTFTDAQTIDITGVGTALSIIGSDDGSAGGPFFNIKRNTASPAAADRLGAFIFFGKDSLGAEKAYGNVRAEVLDPTPGSADGAMIFTTTVADVGTSQISMGDGVTIGAATGGYPGNGKINAIGYSINGSAISSSLFGITPGSVGLAILQDTTAAAVRTEISAQESSANLTTLAGVTPGSKGLAILADTTSAAVRTEIEAAATTANTFTAVQAVTPVALTDGVTITPNLNLGNIFTVTLGGNRTLANPSAMTVGSECLFVIRQDGTGSRTLSFGSYYKFPGGTDPTLTTTASAIDVIAGVVVSSTEILCNASKGFA